ncbi:MAG: hypothetical protein Q9164_006995 [Protoblastenia rupestris]
MGLPSKIVSWHSVTLLLPVLLSVVSAAPSSTGLENANTNALNRRAGDYMIGHPRKPIDPASKMKRRAGRLARRANECKAKKPKLPSSCEEGEAKIDNKCQKCPDGQQPNLTGDKCDLTKCDKPRCLKDCGGGKKGDGNGNCVMDCPPNQKSNPIKDKCIDKTEDDKKNGGDEDKKRKRFKRKSFRLALFAVSGFDIGFALADQGVVDAFGDEAANWPDDVPLPEGPELGNANVEWPDDMVSLDEDDVATNRELGITSGPFGFFGKDPGGAELKKRIIPFLGTVAMGFVRASLGASRLVSRIVTRAGQRGSRAAASTS